MELIKNLGTRLINNRLESWAIFWCDGCEQEVERRLDAGRISKSCGCKKGELISKSKKGKELSEEHKGKLSIANKGKKRTEEQKNNYSKAFKGRKLSEEHKQKIREDKLGKYDGKNNPMFGKKHSEETRQKIKENRGNFDGENNPMFGKYQTKETRQKISEATKGKSRNKGDKNPNWVDGASYEEYGLEFNKKLKTFIKERDNYECQTPNCLNTEDLCIHHIDYDKKNNSLENLTTLCRSCHTKTNNKNKRKCFTEFYQNILINRLMECLL